MYVHIFFGGCLAGGLMVGLLEDIRCEFVSVINK